MFFNFFRPKFNIFAEDGFFPTRSTTGSAGYDLRANLHIEDDDINGIVLAPGQYHVFNTGVVIEPLRKFWMGLVYSRSGLSTNSQIMLLNGVAVIDPDYRGYIHVPLINFSDHDVTIHHGDRIAQLCFCPFAIPLFRLVQPSLMSKTTRGTGGLGHTGVK